ncbi:MAG: hypothetical protein LRY28_02005 [Erysipelotrichaceae bacterium]|nr:hypothetical protein [Erysipelotrichaceae bacterium]
MLLPVVLFLLGVLYGVAAFVEIGLFYEGNPKQRMMIKWMGKRSYKFCLSSCQWYSLD